MFAEVLLKRLLLWFGVSTLGSEVLTPRLPAGFFVGLRPWPATIGPLAPSVPMASNSINHTLAVPERYGAATSEQERCLGCAVAFGPQLLEVIPVEVVDRDDTMLELACRAAPVVADKIGYANGAWEQQDVLEAFRRPTGAALAGAGGDRLPFRHACGGANRWQLLVPDLLLRKLAAVGRQSHAMAGFLGGTSAGGQPLSGLLADLDSGWQAWGVAAGAAGLVLRLDQGQAQGHSPG